jgi:hypothetical protein
MHLQPRYYVNLLCQSEPDVEFKSGAWVRVITREIMPLSNSHLWGSAPKGSVSNVRWPGWAWLLRGQPLVGIDSLQLRKIVVPLSKGDLRRWFEDDFR